MWYAPMNTNLPPFNNLKARQAVNYAIDRNAAVKLFGGNALAQPACQILPPGFPGYEPYCPYTKNPGAKWSAPDLAKAKQLVKESGTAGQKVTIIVQDSTAAQAHRHLSAERAELDRLRRHRSSRSPATSSSPISRTPTTRCRSASRQWYQDYPAASDFLNVLLRLRFASIPGRTLRSTSPASATRTSTPR